MQNKLTPATVFPPNYGLPRLAARMCYESRRQGKRTPPIGLVLLLLRDVHAHGMECSCCRSKIFPMTLGPTAEYGRLLSVSLQHWVDGTFGFVHQTCNVMLGNIRGLGEPQAVEYLMEINEARLLGQPYPKRCRICGERYASTDIVRSRGKSSLCPACAREYCVRWRRKSLLTTTPTLA